MEEQQINLMDYIKTIVKRRRMILAITLGITAFVFLVSFLSPKIYEVSTILEIGGLDANPIELLEQVKNKVETGVYEAGAFKTENPKGTNLLIIKTESSDIKTAKENLEKINNLILKEHEEKINAQEKLIEEDLTRLNNKIALKNEEKNILEDKVDSLEKIGVYQQSSTFKLSYLDEREKLERKINEIEDLHFQVLTLKKSAELMQNTKIIKSPLASSLKGPKILFNTLIALILGLFIGVVTAFCQEWWKKEKQHISG